MDKSINLIVLNYEHMLLMSTTSSVITGSPILLLYQFSDTCRKKEKNYRQARIDSVAKSFLKSACLSVCL